MGWVIHRHGALYSQEYGYDETFEALVAEIAAKFIQQFDPRRERCWIAEKDREIVGSVFLVREEIEDRGQTAAAVCGTLGPRTWYRQASGRECVRFSRQAGYKNIVLWTQSEPPAARHVYQAAGFRLVQHKKHRSWGREDLVSEIWELAL